MMAMSIVPPLAQHIPAYEAAALKYQGKDDAIPFLHSVLKLGRNERGNTSVRDALNTLLDSHVKSPMMLDVVKELMTFERSLGKDNVLSALAQCVEKSPHAEVKAWAVFAQYANVLQSSEVSSDEYKFAKQTTLAAAREFGSKSALSKVLSIEAAREKLIEGGASTDVIGKDLDGVEFKLSDYKGNIILLSFWGHW
jgi:hypothetical protein